LRGLTATRKRPRMPRTRSPPFPYPRPAPQGGRAHVTHNASAPIPCYRTTPTPPRPACPPTAPASVPAGQRPARWEVVLRLRASAVLPGWPLGKVNSNLACSGIPQPPGTLPSAVGEPARGLPVCRGFPAAPIPKYSQRRSPTQPEIRPVGKRSYSGLAKPGQARGYGATHSTFALVAAYR